MGPRRMKESSRSGVSILSKRVEQAAEAECGEGGGHGEEAISVLDARHGGGCGAGGSRYGEPAEQTGWFCERIECSGRYGPSAWVADGRAVRVVDLAGHTIGGGGGTISGCDEGS